MVLSAKEAAIEVIQHLPDDASLEDIMYALYVRQTVESGLRDVAEGRTVSHEEVFRSIDKWLQSIGQ